MPESSVQELDELPPDAAIAADHRNPATATGTRRARRSPK